MITNVTREDAAGILQARIERHGVNFPADTTGEYIERVLRSAEHSTSGENFSLHARATVQAWPELGTFSIRTVVEEV